VLQQWDSIKRTEKGDEEKPYLHGVGKGLPGLLRAHKLQKKASKVGFDWPHESGVLAKIQEELSELQSALESGDIEAVSEEMGDLLFSVVNLTRFRNIDPEVLMTNANAKFEKRFAAMEQILKTEGITLDAATPSQMEDAWETAKANPIG